MKSSGSKSWLKSVKKDKTLQSNLTTKPSSKRDKVIDMKMRNLHLSLKNIHRIANCSYGYARQVWAEYQRSLRTKWASPKDPCSVHGYWYANAVPPRWLKSVSLRVSSNRNQQRRYVGENFIILFHKGGDVFLYPGREGWEEEVKGFLSGFWGAERIKLFMGSLERRGKLSLALNTPKVPKNFRIRIKGVGTLLTDSTPFRDGTTEFEFDPGFNEKLRNVERIQRNQLKAMETFAVGMKEHMKLIKELQLLAKSLRDVCPKSWR